MLFFSLDDALAVRRDDERKDRFFIVLQLAGSYFLHSGTSGVNSKSRAGGGDGGHEDTAIRPRISESSVCPSRSS